MEIIYRNATEADLDEVCELIRSAISNMEKENILQWDEIYPAREDFARDIARNELVVGVIENKIAVIYTINTECEEEYQDGKWKYPNSEFRVVHRLCVHPKYQNQGIGGFTLKHIEAELKKQNVDSIRLDAFCNNPYSLRMYSHHGYEQVGFANWRKGRFVLLEKHT